MCPKCPVSSILVLMDPALLSQRISTLQAALEALDPSTLQAIALKLEGYAGTRSKIFVAGNGGSASTASHLVCDLAKFSLGPKPHRAERRLKIIPLAGSTPMITAIANDEGYDRVFSDQLENLGEAGDLLLCLSHSGESENILSALKSARRMGIETVGLLGNKGGSASRLCDLSLIVESDTCGLVEDVHLFVVHTLTEHFRTLNVAPTSLTSLSA